MRKITLLPLLAFLFSCHYDDLSYKKIDFETYKSYKPSETLVKKRNILVTRYSKDFPQLLLAKNGSYFIFDSNCYLENDSTIIAYSSPFLVDSENGEFQKNGIWLYAEFYKDENKKGNFIYEVSDSGTRFSVDSIPQNADFKKLPTAEGIYFFEGKSLNRITKEQSEDKFYSQNRNGFYFIPNSGRLFNRINLNLIE